MRVVSDYLLFDPSSFSGSHKILLGNIRRIELTYVDQNSDQSQSDLSIYDHVDDDHS